MATTTRLGQMKARFQQKQLQEKEEKLTRLYESQQQRTLERVINNTRSQNNFNNNGRHSVGSNGEISLSTVSSGSSSISSSSIQQQQHIINGPGRVRQMFQERRTVTTKAAGIDKSYPLVPIKGAKTNSKIVKQQTTSARATSLDRYSTLNYSNENSIPKKSINAKTVNKNILTTNNNNNNNNDLYENKRINNVQNDLNTLMSRQHLYESLDDENFPDVELIDDDLDSAFGKLPNVVRQLPSEQQNKQPIKNLKSQSHDSRKNINTVTNIKPETNDIQITTKSKTVNKDVKKSNLQQKTPNSTPQKTMFKTPTTANNRTPIKTTRSPITSTSVKSNMSSSRQPTTMQRLRGAGAMNNSISSTQSVTVGSTVARDDLQPCKYCNRRFAADRLEKHQEICAKTSHKKRKQYDAMKHRVLGTEAEAFVKKGRVSTPPAKSVKSQDWRRKHEEFIQAIRAAKQVQSYLASGGNIKDLPPPPPSSNPDYVQCPHCGRKFNETAAERHIPKCANYSFNKPKPTAQKNIGRQRR